MPHHKHTSSAKRSLIKSQLSKTPSLWLLFSFLGGVGVGILASQTDIIHFFPTPQVWSASSEKAPSLRVCFSPQGHCTEGIVRAIQEAHSSIYVQAYSFTSIPIAQALVEAKKRGVDVRVLLDKSQPTAKHSQLPLLLQNNVPVSTDSAPAIAHNKVMIIDDLFVLTGSFNFTSAAESRNAENLLLIRDPSIAEIYKANWDKRALVSYPYKGTP